MIAGLDEVMDIQNSGVTPESHEYDICVLGAQAAIFFVLLEISRAYLNSQTN